MLGLRGVSLSFGGVKAIDNVLVGADHIPRPRLLTNLSRLPKARRHGREARKRAERVLEFLDISHLRARRASELPFGERKLVDMGRALTTDPKLLLLDEPAAGMPEARH